MSSVFLILLFTLSIRYGVLSICLLSDYISGLLRDCTGHILLAVVIMLPTEDILPVVYFLPIVAPLTTSYWAHSDGTTMHAWTNARTLGSCCWIRPLPPPNVQWPKRNTTHDASRWPIHESLVTFLGTTWRPRLGNIYVEAQCFLFVHLICLWDWEHGKR